MSLAFVLGLSAALHLYIGVRIVPAIPGSLAAALVALLLLASSLLVPAGFFARRFAKPAAAATLAWTGFLFMGLFSSLLALTILLKESQLPLYLERGWMNYWDVLIIIGKREKF